MPLTRIEYARKQGHNDKVSVTYVYTKLQLEHKLLTVSSEI